jgi:3D (Asp-Asp-Asp) domain-containing protein
VKKAFPLALMAALKKRPPVPRNRRELRRALLLGGVLAVLLPVIWLSFRVTAREWTEEQPVPPGVRLRRDWMMQKGWAVTLREGRPGARRVRIHARWRGWRVIEWTELSSTTLREPVKEVRLAGMEGRPNAITAPRLTRVVRSYRMLATAYDAGPLDNSFEHAGTTKLGWRTRRGIVAVDPSVIPLRSLLYVEGYGLAWAGDIGGAIKGKRIDLCFNTTDEAVKWGRRTVGVYVLQAVKR